MANTTTAASPSFRPSPAPAFAGCAESVSAARPWVAGFFPELRRPTLR